MPEQALTGIRVLDLSRHIAGPYCTKILASFGADVLKIEKPGEGDPARKAGPMLHDEPGLERSGLFLYLNCGKKSITLNVKSNEGRKIFKGLVKDADAVVENFKPGTMSKLGLDYWSLAEINPRLVMTSISNFGLTGPYRDYKSSHLIFWNMTGSRYMDGEPGQTPLQGAGWLTHYWSGIHALVGTTAALYDRNETGTGQHVDVSMQESVMLSLNYPVTVNSYLGVTHSDFKPRLGIFECKDGHIEINLLTQSQWEMLCAFFGMPDLTKDPRFETMAAVNEHKEEVRAIFAPLVKEREKAELLQAGIDWRIPLSLVATSCEIVEFPQHQARGFFIDVEHPVMGKVTMPGAPFNMTETVWQLRSPAPLLGEHNEEVYCGRLGYSKEDLVRLREQGVI